MVKVQKLLARAKPSEAIQKSSSLDLRSAELEDILQKDSCLAVDSFPKLQPIPLSDLDSNEFSNIFITGVTGYLGSFLLHRFLSNYKQSTMYCLVTADSLSHGMKRIKDILKSYNLWNLEFEKRIVVCVGNLTKPKFGLQSYPEIVKKIDIIVHCAAAVNFVKSYDALKQANVFGTVEIIRMAAYKPLKHTPIIYISTDGVFPLSRSGTRVILESDIFDKNISSLADGYCQSKCVAELLMIQARDELNLNISIVRPGQICGDSITGVYNKNHEVMRVIHAAIIMKSAPLDNRLVDITPVDIVAQTIVNISLSPSLHFNKIFNLVHPLPVRIADIIRWLTSSIGYEIEFELPEKWISNLSKSKDSTNPAVALWPSLSELMNHDDVYFECSLWKKNSQPSPYSTLSNSIRYMVRSKIIPPPQNNSIFGKVAIVTGASSGIGESIAYGLAKKGVLVAVAARREDRLKLIKAKIERHGGTALCVPTDVLSRDDLKRLLHKTGESFGPVDILVNSAGIMPASLMKNLRQDEWDLTLDVNIKGVTNAIAVLELRIMCDLSTNVRERLIK